MKIRRIFLKALPIVILAAIMAKPTLAQIPEPIWFWAWRSYDLDVEQLEDQRGDLLAFTPDGMVNVLLENSFPVVLQRIDDTQAFVVGKIDDTYYLYYLTPSQAIPVIELFDQSYVDELRNYALYDGYVYFMPEIISMGVGRYLIADTKRDQYAIFDSSQNSTISLDLRAWCHEDCVRVSEDGRYIRYRVSASDPTQSSTFVDPNEDSLPYQIYEYDVVNETERLIYEKEIIEVPEGNSLPHVTCTPDQYGERWYCALFLDDGVNEIWMADEKIIVYADGSIESVNPDWQLRVFDNRWYFLDLDRARDNCDPCLINFFPDGNEAETFQFEASSQQEFSLYYGAVEMLSEQYLLLNPTGSPIYLLSQSGEVTELGMRACCADPISQDFYDEETGWMIVINIEDFDAPRTEIWNTRPLERIASLSVNIVPGVRSTFRDYSLVLFHDGPNGNPAVVYSYLDEALYEFDFSERRGYIDAFSGGVLLVDYGDEYGSYSTYADANDGIYRWTLIGGETLLLDGAVAIPNRW